jgi:hypothetical protein
MKRFIQYLLALLMVVATTVGHAQIGGEKITTDAALFEPIARVLTPPEFLAALRLWADHGLPCPN